MTRRTWTLLVSVALSVVLGVLGGTVRVPYVALGPGPTFDVLGETGGATVVQVEGTRTYPTTGQLNMTTVSVVDDVTLFGALGLWVSGRNALVPREEVFPPQLSEEQVQQQNVQLFEDSEGQAETAALRHLGYPSTVVVDQVAGGQPADGRLEPGDRLLAVRGRPVTAARDVVDALAGSAAGEAVPVRFRRGERPERTESLVLGAGEDPGRGYLGIGVADQPDVDFEVTISLADVGGPSAGLMFALGIVDKLTPGDLADERFVAGTGEISPNGAVGPIGGIPFKMLRASEAGATVFLVPAANCPEALSRTPDGLQLVRVDELAGAVAALETLAAGGTPPSC